MNCIVITQKSGKRITFMDDEDISADELLKKLSSLYSSTNISIIKTSTSSIIIRPSDISSIVVEPYNDPTLQQQQTQEMELQPLKEDDHIDIITDKD